MKVGVIIICYNISSEIFLLQIAAIKKFCKDEHEILVVDNSSDLELAENIRYHATHQGISYLKTFAGSSNSSDSHSWAANFAYQKYKDSFDYLLFLDHDIIPVQMFSVIDTLNGGHVLAGVGQGAKKKYMWPGLLYVFNAAIDKDLVDFSPNLEFGLDTGGNLYKIIEKAGEESCVFFNESYHQNSNYSGKVYNHYSMLADLTFMHFVNSSNWNRQPDNQERINSLIGIAKEKTGL